MAKRWKLQAILPGKKFHEISRAEFSSRLLSPRHGELIISLLLPRILITYLRSLFRYFLPVLPSYALGLEYQNIFPLPPSFWRRYVTPLFALSCDLLPRLKFSPPYLNCAKAVSVCFGSEDCLQMNSRFVKKKQRSPIRFQLLICLAELTDKQRCPATPCIFSIENLFVCGVVKTYSNVIALSFVVDQVRREVRVSARISVVRVEQLFVLKIARLSHIIGARRTLRLAVSSPLLLSKLLLLLMSSDHTCT